MIDLVQVVAADGVKLDGALHSAATPCSVPVDAFICLHGTGSNFYSSSLMATLAPRLTATGAAILAVNTRGHDLAYLAATRGGRKLLGSSHELVDECRLDVAAWLAFLHGRGLTRIALLGHSLGAVKILYALSRDEAPSVACAIALSPPRLSHAKFAASPHGERFLAEHSRAVELVLQGRGETLIDATVPLPYPITAASYLDKYGQDERYDLLRFVERVRVPALFAFGSQELFGAAFAGLPEQLETMRHAGEGRPWRTAIIAGADHNYTGAQHDLAQAIEAWLHRLPETDKSP